METWEEIKEFKIGERTESDHPSLEITLEKQETEEKKEKDREELVRENWEKEGKIQGKSGKMESHERKPRRLRKLSR